MVVLDNNTLTECSTITGYCKEAGTHMDQNRFETAAFPFAKPMPMMCLSPQGFNFFLHQFCLITGSDSKTSPSLIFRRDEISLSVAAPSCHIRCCEPVGTRNYSSHRCLAKSMGTHAWISHSFLWNFSAQHPL